MGKTDDSRIAKRGEVVELFCRLINSGVCDRNLGAIKNSITANIAHTPTLSWHEACEIMKVGRSKFYEIVERGEIKKVDANAYDTQSVIKWVQQFHN